MNRQNFVVYQAHQRMRLSWVQTWVTMFRNMYKSRELVYQLFRRDFLMQYKKSFVGMGWLVLSPLIGVLSWVFLNATGVLNPGDTGINYLAYVLLSSSLWGLFMSFYGSAAGTLGAGAGFISQVKYPHEALLLKQLLQSLFGFLITLVLNIVVLLIFKVTPDWKIILFPLLVIPMMMFGAALGLVISVISVVATDISSIFNTMMGFLFYITPIVYSQDVPNDFLRMVMQLNPLTYLVGGVRDIIINGNMNYPERFLFATVVSAVMFLIALRLFYVSEDKLIEKMI